MAKIIRSLKKKNALLIAIFLFLLLSIGIAARAEAPSAVFSAESPTGEIDSSSAIVTATVSCPDGIQEATTYLELDGIAKIPVYILLFDNKKTAIVKYLASGLTPGVHTASIMIMDGNNNYNKKEWSFTVKNDPSSARSINVIVSPEGSVQKLRPSISATISGLLPEDSVEMQLDGSAVYSGNGMQTSDGNRRFVYVPTSDLSIGSHSVKLTVRNKEKVVIKEVNDWSFTIESGASLPANGTGESPAPVIYFDYSGNQIPTARYPANYFEKIKAYDPQGPLGLGLTNAKVLIKEYTESDNKFSEITTATFVYDTQPPDNTPNISRGTFRFKLMKSTDEVYPDGRYIIRTQIENGLGTVSIPLDTQIIIRNVANQTNCTICHKKQPYDHSTKNCDGCHQFIDPKLRTGYNSWPHGPEVFLNTELPSTPVLCEQCHFNSKLDFTVATKVYSTHPVKDHLFID